MAIFFWVKYLWQSIDCHWYCMLCLIEGQGSMSVERSSFSLWYKNNHRDVFYYTPLGPLLWHVTFFLTFFSFWSRLFYRIPFVRSSIEYQFSRLWFVFIFFKIYEQIVLAFSRYQIKLEYFVSAILKGAIGFF